MSRAVAIAAAAAVALAATLALAAGCPGPGAGTAAGRAAAPGADAPLPERVVTDFERAVLDGREAYATLFDFVAVGKFEKLLRRYDAMGRIPLDDAQRAEFLAEDAIPFSEARERRNLGAFFPILAARTVGRGGCSARAPISAYGRLLGQPFEPLPAEPASNAAYESLRVDVNALIAEGGVVALSCTGGKGGLALVYTRTTFARGYAIITMYDDIPE